MSWISFFLGKLRSDRRFAAQAIAFVLVSTVFVGLYAVTRRAVLDEVRSQAMGVAAAAAAGIQADDLLVVRSPEDAASAAFRRVQAVLDNISRFNPDVRYAYTMRRSQAADSAASDMEFVVDQAAVDRDGDGTIADDERSEPVGAPYDASSFPALLAAWNQPSADHDITQDPPYPNLISGYAPVLDADGNAVAIVGADITADTVAEKLFFVRLVIITVAVFVVVLVAMLLQFVFEQKILLEERDALITEIQATLGSLTTVSGLLPICSCCKKIRNDQGYWEKLESFFAEKSRTEFTHSICPECMDRHYPDGKARV